MGQIHEDGLPPWMDSLFTEGLQAVPDPQLWFLGGGGQVFVAPVENLSLQQGALCAQIWGCSSASRFCKWNRLCHPISGQESTEPTWHAISSACFFGNVPIQALIPLLKKARVVLLRFPNWGQTLYIRHFICLIINKENI